jgi:HlyD family secretion protein
MAASKTFKLIRTLIGWIIFLSLIGGPAAYFYLKEPIIDVTVITLKRGPIEQTISAFSSGTVEPKVSSMVAPESIGKVMAVHVKKGQRVEKGDVLVELDCTQQSLQVAQAEARIAQANIGIRLLKEQYGNDQGRIEVLKRTRDLAAHEFGKDKKLLEKDDVGSESMVNLSEINYNQIDDTYKNLSNLVSLYPLRIQEAETALNGATLLLEQAKVAAEWTKVCAPFSGLIADTMVEVGEIVGGGLGAGLSGGLGGGAMMGGGMGAMGGAALAAGGGGGGLGGVSPLAVVHLVDDSDMYVKAPFDESTFGKLELGQPVRLTFDPYPDEEFPGRVSHIAATVTKNLDRSRTFEVEILIEKGKERLIPGMSADAVIIANSKDNVLYVPTEALIREEEGYVVEDGRAVRRKVTMGIGNWMTREVLDGLRENEVLITSVSVKGLRDGAKVNILSTLEQ